MSEALEQYHEEPLKLSSDWRLPDGDGGATIHPLRVISGSGRGSELRDREAMRALIAEVVREELRADLGRRVTQIVKDLVRREVARLLSRRNVR